MRAHSAVLKASWKFSLGSLGLRIEYSKASGKNRCTKAQKAMPSFQLEEKFRMSTPCFTAEREIEIVADIRAELCIAPWGNNSQTKRVRAYLPHMALFWPCTSPEASV